MNPPRLEGAGPSPPASASAPPPAAPSSTARQKFERTKQWPFRLCCCHEAGPHLQVIQPGADPVVRRPIKSGLAIGFRDPQGPVGAVGRAAGSLGESPAARPGTRTIRPAARPPDRWELFRWTDPGRAGWVPHRAPDGHGARPRGYKCADSLAAE